MSAVLLALCASAAWGVSDFFAGLKSRSLPLYVVLVSSQLAGFLVIGPLLAIRGIGPPDAIFALYAGLTAVFGFVGVSALYRGLAIGTMGVVAPISATAPLVPVVAGLIRGERPSVIQYAGMAVALVGIALASREPGAGRSARLALGAGLGGVAAVCFGLSLLGLNEASNHDPYWATVAVRIGMATLVGLALLATRPSFAGVRAAWPTLAVVGVLDVGAVVLFSVASTRGLLSVVAVLSSLYPVVIVALARAVVKERLAPIQLVGATAALAGAALLSAG